MLGGADDMIWNLIISTDGSTANDSAYHEYFVVIQAPQGELVHIEDINIGASFRNPNALWFDGWDHISMTLGDVIWGPPVDIECYEVMNLMLVEAKVFALSPNLFVLRVNGYALHPTPKSWSSLPVMDWTTIVMD